MSFINANWYIALAFCLFFFIGGRQLAETPGGTAQARRAIGLCFFVIALPSLLFPLAYLSDRVAASAWYNTFRTVNRIELLSALVAPAAGYATYLKPPSPYRTLREPLPSAVMRVIKPLAFPLCVLFISMNFVKPLLKPLDKNAAFDNIWSDRSVLMQPLADASGPAALVSAMYSLNYYAENAYDVAKNTYADGAGTEFWYLARYAVNRGYKIQFIESGDPANSPVPSIMPVFRVSSEYGGRPGEATYISLLGRSEGGNLIIGDPAAGRLEIDAQDFSSYYSEPNIILALSTRRAGI